MKRSTLLVFFTFLIQYQSDAQCDSIVVTNIEIPESDSLDISISVYNYTSTHHIYLNLILKDVLTDQIIAESDGGYLQLYPNQTNTYVIDTTIIFGQWQLYYELEDIPDISNISVCFDPFPCDELSWESPLSTEDLSRFNPLILYPNPTTNYLLIEGKKNVEFSILNYLGQIVIKSKSESDKIDVRGLPKGTYLLKFENDPYLSKFIKE